MTRTRKGPAPGRAPPAGAAGAAVAGWLGPGAATEPGFVGVGACGCGFVGAWAWAVEAKRPAAAMRGYRRRRPVWDMRRHAISREIGARASALAKGTLRALSGSETLDADAV